MIVLAGLAAPVSADDAPTTQPARPTPDSPDRTPPLKFDELSFELGFEAEAQRRRVTTDTRQRYASRHRQTNDEWRFEETLGMRSSGTLFGQRVMRFDTFARWGLSQERFNEKSPGRNLASSPDAQILDYDCHLEVFPA
ncbi:MAG: hypothetical protein IID33_06805, partial [Planctomycetes bacterium]|nr:hypothetical protein [Planctomycetota bacterium]